MLALARRWRDPTLAALRTYRAAPQTPSDGRLGYTISAIVTKKTDVYGQKLVFRL
jgi:hypothetical protein